MTKNINITCIQTILQLDQKQQNIAAIEKYIDAIDETDIIVLPEMFPTGFTMDTSLAESMSGETIATMKKRSSTKNAVICGSLSIKEHGKYYNRFVRVSPDGSIASYDKKHLFPFKEIRTYTPGHQKTVLQHKEVTITPFVCYDLRFPVRMRNTDNSELMIVIANRPTQRISQWKILLQARAIENQCYVIGVNAVGPLNDNRINGGNSLVLDYTGNVLFEAPVDMPCIQTLSLDMDSLYTYKKDFPFHTNADAFTLQL